MVAAIAWIAAGSYPVHDTIFHLVWGRELLDGHAPGFETFGAPTPHPLLLALGAVLSPLPGADRIFVSVSMVAYVLLLAGTYRLGSAIFGRWSGLAAMVLMGGGLGFILSALTGHKDMPFLALVVWAGAIEARSPRRGLPVVLMLSLAGLLRPEAWLLAGGYWLWCLSRWTPRERLGAAALVAAPPVLWASLDLLITGNPIHSLTYTSALAEELGRERGLTSVPGSFVRNLGRVVYPAVIPLGLLGALMAWRWEDRRRLFVPGLFLAVGVVTYIGIGIAGLSLISRYLSLPGIALCVFGGYALLGFTSLPAGSPRRKAWMAATAVIAVIGAAVLVVKTPRVDLVFEKAQFLGDGQRELAGLLKSEQVRRGFACGPVTLPGHRLVPETRWLIDDPTIDVGARTDRRHPAGVSVSLRGDEARSQWGEFGTSQVNTNSPGRGYLLVERSEHFAAYVRCP